MGLASYPLLVVPHQLSMNQIIIQDIVISNLRVRWTIKRVCSLFSGVSSEVVGAEGPF